MSLDTLFNKISSLDFLTLKEAVFLWDNTSTPELIFLAHQIRKKLHPNQEVSWIIDRNVNYTNVCYSGCLFCNFHHNASNQERYITNLTSYQEKITHLRKLGGDQLLLQGGLHPALGLDYYTTLFKDLKKIDPEVKLHALGPPEIVHISKKEKISYKETLLQLKEAGLDSLPGAGAEILSDRVRSLLSPRKCSTQEWLDVMETAHQLNILTTATCMFGHIETLKERFEHLIALQQLQEKKPTDSVGFISFIPWPFQGEGTLLKEKTPLYHQVGQDEYIRMIAMSRIMLPNIPNIQASWLTVGKETAQICLHSGANDFGSIMIEEHVVSAAGANYQFDKEGICDAIREAGFIPVQRNQKFERQP